MHIADIRNIVQANDVLVNKIIDTSDNKTHLEQYDDWDYSGNFINDVKIDQDMSSDRKLKFRSLCEEFKDIINYRPAKYNGYLGENSTDELPFSWMACKSSFSAMQEPIPDFQC